MNEETKESLEENGFKVGSVEEFLKEIESLDEKVDRLFPRITHWKRLKRVVRFWYQRRTRGWDDSETWDLDAQLAAYLVPRLRRFKEINNCCPGHLTEEEWDARLNEMIELFSSYEEEFNSEKQARAWRLLGENGNYLWW